MSDYEHTIRWVYRQAPTDISDVKLARWVTNWLIASRHWKALEQHLAWANTELDDDA